MDFLEILKAIFDVFSLAAILFFIYRFAVKRRAVKLVLGVVLFWLALVIVDATELVALGFVLGDIRQIGLVAIIIIFQPELRSALDKIGGSTFEGIQKNINASASRSDSTGRHEVIEAVARSAQDLSDVNYGALIVLERDDSLYEYKSSGARLDSVVTADALNAIFYKGAALHDGAVIIRDGRIDSARCVMPMTSRVDIPAELGTRHRAAIGISEQTDAVVVIVSEESGIISISMGGELERGYTYATLRTRLDEILNPIQDENDKHKAKKHSKKKNNRHKSSAAKSGKKKSQQ